MERKAWTKRGEMLEDDRGVIRSIADNSKVSARIFVTGEVSESYIGEAAVRFLVNINDVYYENNAGTAPLFVETKQGTIRMARFDPKFVWGCFHPDIMVSLLKAEIARLGIEMDPWKMDHFDFYEAVVAALKVKTGDAVAVVERGSSAEDFYNAAYLSCLLLFEKPGYMGVPAAEHFAQPSAADFLRTADVFPLNLAAKNKLNALREQYGKIETLTNPEMRFVLELYKRALK